MVTVIQKLSAAILSLLLGGALALVLLLGVCIGLDAIAATTSSVQSSSTAVGTSGDSSFGNAATVLMLIFGPWAFALGLVVFSYPIYHLLFKARWGYRASVEKQLLWAVGLTALLGGITASYFGSRFYDGLYWGGIAGAILGGPAVWLRSVMRQH